MHEDVHQWAEQQRKVDEDAEDMRAMFGEEQDCGDHGETEKDQDPTRPWRFSLRSMVLNGGVGGRHDDS